MALQSPGTSDSDETHRAHQKEDTMARALSLATAVLVALMLALSSTIWPRET
jgi:hypothetical protein